MDKIIEVINSVTEMLKTLIGFIDGYKTYIAAGAMILIGIIHGNMSEILIGLTFITTRQAVDKVGRAVKNGNN